MAKNLILDRLLAPKIFYLGQISSRTIPKKATDPILRKFSDGRIDGQTDESDFIGLCPTSLERPI